MNTVAVEDLMVSETGFAHSFKVGDVLYSTWGWEQTNVDFFVITRVSAKSVWVVEVSRNYVEEGFMCGHSTPDLTSRGEREYRLSAVTRDGRGKDGLNNPLFSCAGLWKWKGNPVYESHYA